MSESELDAILNEIRNHSKGGNANPPSDNDVQSALDSFSLTKDEPPKQEPSFMLDEEPAVEPVKPVEDVINELLHNGIEDKPVVEAPDVDEPIINDNDLALFSMKESIDTTTDEYEELDEIGELYENKPNKHKKAIIIAVIAVIVAIAIGIGIYFGVFAKDKPEKPTTTKPQAVEQQDEPIGDTDIITNPLTGEAGFNQSALTQRPVAVVVENEYSSRGVRPQWGIDKADIILEGESECSTRALLFWADYNNVPEKVGPTRSARPPFIRFSQLFDAVFIHAGLSRSKGSYVGADTVFKNEGIDHINLLSYSTDGEFMGRDYSRTSTVEHTGYLNGTNTAKLLQTAKVRTELKPARFTTLKFSQEPINVGTANGAYAYFKWSTSCPDSIEVEYDATDKVYRTNHFDSSSSGEEANCKWTNCVFLLDNTTYVVKENYKHAGQSETYCNYALDGGDGMVLSNGTAVKIKWGVSNGKLWLKNAETNEEITLNAGKTYIGYGSSNHGGTISLDRAE